MQTVNIYIYTTIRGPQKQDGAYIYVLETMTSKGPATCSKAGTMNKVTKNQACLFALSAAIKRIFRQCELIIHVDSVFVASCAEKWLADWRKNDWKNAKGQQVANAEAWKEIAFLFNPDRAYGRPEVCYEASGRERYLLGHGQARQAVRKAVC